MKHSATFDGLTLPSAPDWPGERQRVFLTALARTGDVAAAAAHVGETAATLHSLRRARGRNSNFARAWSRARMEAKLDALATRILRNNGLSQDQLARVDAACHGRDKACLTLDLLRRSGSHGAARPAR